MSPAGTGSRFGDRLAAAGDVNGDGYGDFLIGADVINNDSPGAYLYLGSGAPTAAAWNPGSAPARIDLVKPDTGADTAFGSAVAGAGDINGDGYADFLVGGDKAYIPGGGMAHVYLGGAAPSASAWNAVQTTARIDLANPAGSSSHFGSSVAAAGDINGDGYADFLVGVDEADPASPAAYVYLGSVTPSAALWNGSSSARIDLLNPGATDRFDSSVSGAGDIDGNGLADFIVGTFRSPAAGTTHLYLGASVPIVAPWNGTGAVGRIDLSNPQTASGNDDFGHVVAGAGDVDADGHCDFLVATPHPHAAQAVVHFYLGSPLPSGTLWNGASAARRFELVDPEPSDNEFGMSMSGAR